MKDETPKFLKPYFFHGVELLWGETSTQAVGDCPFCGKEKKFSVKVETGQWRCLVCGTGNEKGGGNIAVFLRSLYEISSTDLPEWLVEGRKVSLETLLHWGVRVYRDEVILPGYGVDGKLNQLYRYVEGPDGKRRLLATPECHHQVHMEKGEVDKAKTVYVCEGPWDAMALWEVMASAKVTEEGMALTGNIAASLLSDAAVIAVPGCSTFNEAWCRLLAGKRVVLMYDSDWPREQNGKTFLAGWHGMRRVSQILARAEQPPESVECIHWGPEGFDPQLPNGADVRDWLAREGGDIRERISRLDALLAMVGPIPDDWVAGRSPEAKKKGSVDLECVPCDNMKALVNQWRKAMKWTDGLDRALACMLASATSTMGVGDQLWFKVIGPAACGKSTLCEALSVNRKYVYANSTMTGIHSGWKTDSAGADDHGLVPKIRDKTMVIKDGDTLIQAANRDKTLADLRDLYDRVSRIHYGNAVSRDYDCINMTLILCGTSSLRMLDSSELGERFLDCVIMEGIDDDLEDEILLRKIRQVKRTIGIEAGRDKSTSNDPDLTLAMQMTGGYVAYLRENAMDLLNAVEVSEEMERRITHYGKFTAFMRARPSIKQDETAEREFATRLVSQMGRLAYCLCVVLNKKEMDDEVDRRVRRVALDTSRGGTFDIVTHLKEAGDRGLVTKTLMVKTHQTEAKLRDLLRFLRRIGAVEYPEFRQPGLAPVHRWILSQRMSKLYEEVVIRDQE